MPSNAQYIERIGPQLPEAVPQSPDEITPCLPEALTTPTTRHDAEKYSFTTYSGRALSSFHSDLHDWDKSEKADEPPPYSPRRIIIQLPEWLGLIFERRWWTRRKLYIIGGVVVVAIVAITVGVVLSQHHTATTTPTSPTIKILPPNPNSNISSSSLVRAYTSLTISQATQDTYIFFTSPDNHISATTLNRPSNVVSVGLDSSPRDGSPLAAAIQVPYDETNGNESKRQAIVFYTTEKDELAIFNWDPQRGAVDFHTWDDQNTPSSLAGSKQVFGGLEVTNEADIHGYLYGCFNGSGFQETFYNWTDFSLQKSTDFQAACHPLTVWSGEDNDFLCRQRNTTGGPLEVWSAGRSDNSAWIEADTTPFSVPFDSAFCIAVRFTNETGSEWTFVFQGLNGSLFHSLVSINETAPPTIQWSDPTVLNPDNNVPNGTALACWSDGPANSTDFHVFYQAVTGDIEYYQYPNTSDGTLDGAWVHGVL